MKKTKTNNKVEETKTRTQFHTHRVNPIAPFNRLHALLYSGAIIALVYHRLTSPFSLSTISLLVAELVLALMWGTSQAFRWRPVRRQEFPEHLMASIGKEGLPALDVFVCTADAFKEPPSDVASTVLSVMGFDYPTDRLSVYVSDDGGSDMTLFALMEAARFARHWLPFCRENGIEQRSPEAYFRDGGVRSGHSEQIKVVVVVGNSLSGQDISLELVDVAKEVHLSAKSLQISEGLTKVISKHQNLHIHLEIESLHGDGRVMFVDGSWIIADSIIYCTGYSYSFPFLDTKGIVVIDENRVGPLYEHTFPPSLAPSLSFVGIPRKIIGFPFFESQAKWIAQVLSRKRTLPSWDDMMKSIKEFYHSRDVAGIPKRNTHDICCFEIGFQYGSLVEDFNTGYRLHCEGWKSVLCDTQRPAFLGEAPKSLNDTLSQYTRWSVGLYEVAFSKYSPLTFGIMRTSLLSSLGYAHYAFSATWFIPATIYGFIPQLALANEIPLYPKLSDPWFYLYVYLFLAAYGQDFVEFIATNGTVGKWWNDQRMWMIRGVTDNPFATAQFVLNQLGISTPGFNVTSKVTEDGLKNRYDNGVFEFGMVSPFFVSLGTVAIVNLTSFVVGSISAVRKEAVFDRMFIQLFLSGFVVANSWPVYEAMFIRRVEGRMPRVVTTLSILIAVLFEIYMFLPFRLVVM